eukprot:Gb_20873 [translate_table: standard]
MPAPSFSDLRRNQTRGLVDDHLFLAKLADMKTSKREIIKGSGLESAQKSFATNPKQRSPTRVSNPADPMQLKNTAGKIPNPPRKSSGARLGPADTSPHPQAPQVNHGYSVNPSENRIFAKPGPENNNIRQYPKSPLASLLKKGQVKGNEVNRLLVTVNVLGSAGPLRFLVSADDSAHRIMETALKSYAREGRLPVLGQNIKQFDLYCANSGSEALDPTQIIGALGTRNFLLCKKQQTKQEEERVVSTAHHHHHKNNLWKNWLNTMSLNFGVSSH